MPNQKVRNANDDAKKISKLIREGHTLEEVQKILSLDSKQIYYSLKTYFSPNYAKRLKAMATENARSPKPKLSKPKEVKKHPVAIKKVAFLLDKSILEIDGLKYFLRQYSDHVFFITTSTRERLKAVIAQNSTSNSTIFNANELLMLKSLPIQITSSTFDDEVQQTIGEVIKLSDVYDITLLTCSEAMSSAFHYHRLKYILHERKTYIFPKSVDIISEPVFQNIVTSSTYASLPFIKNGVTDFNTLRANFFPYYYMVKGTQVVSLSSTPRDISQNDVIYAVYAYAIKVYVVHDIYASSNAILQKAAYFNSSISKVDIDYIYKCIIELSDL